MQNTRSVNPPWAEGRCKIRSSDEARLVELLRQLPRADFEFRLGSLSLGLGVLGFLGL